MRFKLPDDFILCFIKYAYKIRLNRDQHTIFLHKSMFASNNDDGIRITAILEGWVYAFYLWQKKEVESKFSGNNLSSPPVLMTIIWKEEGRKQQRTLCLVQQFSVCRQLENKFDFYPRFPSSTKVRNEIFSLSLLSFLNCEWNTWNLTWDSNRISYFLERFLLNCAGEKTQNSNVCLSNMHMTINLTFFQLQKGK